NTQTRFGPRREPTISVVERHEGPSPHGKSRVAHPASARRFAISSPPSTISTSMDTARIAELLQPFLGPAEDQRLTANDLFNISIYIDLLLRWNARINLTAIRQPEEIVTRHFGESLFAARQLFPQ